MIFFEPLSPLYQYTTPILYTYEALMAVELHQLKLACNSIVPSGPGYTDARYQTCAAAGSRPGSLFVNGDDYLNSSYGFYFNHVWRNFGIVVLFTIAFIAVSTWLNEVLEWNGGADGAVTYCGKRRHDKESKHDEEHTNEDVDYYAPPRSTDSEKTLGGSHDLQQAESTFTWRSLNYTIQTSSSERVLLNDVSGYCQPGQLTALVGASGAGKSTCKWNGLFLLKMKPVLTSPNLSIDHLDSTPADRKGNR